jgi:glycosyltransferase involved in cell wall biosynthesis
MPSALFVHDTWYATSPEGEFYAYGAFPYSLWQTRFLPHFERLHVIGRYTGFDEQARNLDRADGHNVTFTLLPNINAPLKRILQSRSIYRRIAAEVEKVDAVIVRGPAEFGMMAARAARRARKPVAVEMSGCAFDHTWYHGSIVGKLYAPIKYLRCRHMVKRADQVIYVTQNFLQTRYPTLGAADTASNVEIAPPERGVLQQRLKRIDQREDMLVFGMIGNLGNHLKGFDIALQALSEARDVLPPFSMRVLGQGDWQDWADIIQLYGLEERIALCGTVPGGSQVSAWLDDLDIYLHPSRHEGLPRAVIEAMSRGLPVLASDAGGTDELLDAQLIHRRGDAQTLARQLVTLADGHKLQKKAAKDNFDRAQYYTYEKLQPVRDRFWARFAGLASGKDEQQSR